MTGEESDHMGIIGMHWGKRKALKAQKRADAIKRRDTITERLRKENPEEYKKLQEVALKRGVQRTKRIIDIMGKYPEKSVKLAARKELGEIVLRRSLTGPIGDVIIQARLV